MESQSRKELERTKFCCPDVLSAMRDSLADSEVLFVGEALVGNDAIDQAGQESCAFASCCLFVDEDFLEKVSL